MSVERTERVDARTGPFLVQIARSGLIAFVERYEYYQPELNKLPPLLICNGSSFVTLVKRGRLRGCIGSTNAAFPLALDVARNAAAAARDPRFAPVEPAELPEIRLEVTVLHPPEHLPYEHDADLVQKLRPRIDGVILSWQERRALLLPQVWERVSEPQEFLTILCHKAGIPHRELRAVPPTIAVFVFQADSFEEDGYYIEG